MLLSAVGSRSGVSFADEVAAKTPDRDKLGRIAELLEKSNIDLAEVGRIDKVRIGEYQMLTKNDDGEAEIHDLRADSLVLTPAWADGPQWPVVQPAKPCIVKPVSAPKSGRKAAESGSGWRTCVVLPDTQIGYRRYEDGTLDPFHDEAAMDVALQIIRHTRPDLVILLGDYVDFPEFGTYEQEPEFAATTQASVDRAHRFLAQIRANAPEAEIRLIEGNHDRRLPKAIARNAIHALRLRRANEPEGWPVLSVPNLLRLDELGVTYVDGYPAGITWINDNVACIHGHKVRSSGSTAAAVIDDERVSTIFGHIHRIEMQSKTRRVRDGHRVAWAASPGCLCRLDGAVPSMKSSTDVFGRPVNTAENWAQGLGVVSFEPGNGRFAYEQVAIYSGEATFRGRPFAASALEAAA